MLNTSKLFMKYFKLPMPQLPVGNENRQEHRFSCGKIDSEQLVCKVLKFNFSPHLSFIEWLHPSACYLFCKRDDLGAKESQNSCIWVLKR